MAKRASKKDTARKFAIEVARLAAENHGADILILDLRDVSPVTDYFVICTGTSGRQMRAVADEICKLGKETGQRVWKKAGLEAGDWILLDFVDIVVHLFDSDHRRYYDLELIWGAVPHVRWRRAGT